MNTVNPKISVIIVTYNSSEVIDSCLSSLGEPSSIVEVIVVDNASSDDTVDRLKSHSPEIKYVQTGANLGFAAAVNLAAEISTGQYVCLLNPDARISQNDLVAMSTTADRSMIGVIAPLIVHPSGRLRIVSAGHQPTVWRMFTHYSGLSRFGNVIPALEGHYLLPGQLGTEVRDVEWVTGACMIVSRACWDGIGGMSTRWFMYAEDIDFCHRARQAGFRVAIDPAVTATHAVGGSAVGHSSRINSAWVVNLYDMYVQNYHPTTLQRLCWKATVAGGMLSRAAIYALKARNGDTNWLFEARRFRVHARDVVRASSSTQQSGPMRYYPVARRAHLERLANSNVRFYYSKTRLDWDPELARAVGARRSGLFSLLARVHRERPAVLEIPEPLAIALIPQIIAIRVFVLLNGWVRGHRTELVTYAIENLDPAIKLANKLHVPVRLSRWVLVVTLKPLLRGITRTAYGTEGSRQLYAEYGDRQLDPFTRRIFPALPQKTRDEQQKDPGLIAFVGSFDHRKGVRELMRAWPSLKKLAPTARMTLMGHGELTDEVLATAGTLQDVDVVVDPPRAAIDNLYRRAKVIVLLSQRTPMWREQVGLPIVEALAHGCLVVTTSETGIAEWLSANGHYVLAPDATSAEISVAVAAALQSALTQRDVKNQLPETDARLAAELWLLNEAEAEFG